MLVEWARLLGLGLCLLGISGEVARAEVAFACDSPLIDARSIAKTDIAKRLVAASFREDPKGSGVYQREGVSLQWLEKNLGLTDRRPASSVDRWTEEASIEGNHTVLVEATGKAELQPGDRWVKVSVNLAYARPLQICAGMTVHRVAAALAHLRAEEQVGGGKLQGQRPGIGVRAWVLPDKTALIVEHEPPSRSGLKPNQPLVTGLVLGQAGKGFKGWQDQEKKRKKVLSLQLPPQ